MFEKRGFGNCPNKNTSHYISLHIITLTGSRLSIMVDVVVGFILLVLPQDILAGHSRDDRQVSWGSLGDGRIAPVQ